MQVKSLHVLIVELFMYRVINYRIRSNFRGTFSVNFASYSAFAKLYGYWQASQLDTVRVIWLYCETQQE